VMVVPPTQPADPVPLKILLELAHGVGLAS